MPGDGLNPAGANVEPMTGTRLVAVGVCVLLLAGAVPPAAAVHDTERQFIVDLEADGSATVTFERSYNLSVPGERDRFGALANNSTALAERRVAFGEQLRPAAANGSERTAREMRIENVTVTTRRANDTGVVALQARWENLAGVYGAQVVVNEPFSTSFDPNGTLTVRGPEGYVRDDTAPRPDRALRTSASWGEGTDLSGFSFRFVDPDAVTSADQGTATPPPEPTGVGRLVGAVGLALVPALLVFLGAKRRELRLEAAPADGEAAGDGDGATDGDDATEAASDADGTER
jgi:hypothetical protein